MPSRSRQLIHSGQKDPIVVVSNEDKKKYEAMQWQGGNVDSLLFWGAPVTKDGANLRLFPRKWKTRAESVKNSFMVYHEYWIIHPFNTPKRNDQFKVVKHTDFGENFTRA